MRTTVLVTALILTLTSVMATAGGMTGDMSTGGMPMMAQQQQMNQALEHARKATDPAARHEAMKAHTQAMQKMMNTMMGGTHKPGDCTGHASGMPMMDGGMMGGGMGMMKMMFMMHQRMQMMQQMMSQMLAHEALEEQQQE